MFQYHVIEHISGMCSPPPSHLCVIAVLSVSGLGVDIQRHVYLSSRYVVILDVHVFWCWPSRSSVNVRRSLLPLGTSHCSSPFVPLSLCYALSSLLSLPSYPGGWCNPTFAPMVL